MKIMLKPLLDTTFLVNLQVIHLKHTSVTKKRDARNAVALDAENNNIQVKDIVKVIDGEHSVSFLDIALTVCVLLNSYFELENAT